MIQVSWLWNVAGKFTESTKSSGLTKIHPTKTSCKNKTLRICYNNEEIVKMEIRKEYLK